MKLFFIGAGPGDPDLLTIKAQKILKQADIIIYAGSLVNREILAIRKPGAQIYDSATMCLEEVFSLFYQAKDTDRIVARLHSGDPSLYGAIQEQMEWCDQQGIDYEVIPGVSSFCAAGAALKQELTLPGVSQTVILSRVSGKTKVPAKEDLKALAKIGATLVLFLSIDKIDEIIQKLLCGYGPTTPVAVVYKASWPDEKKIMGTLSTIAEKIRAEGIKKQALVIVGETLRKTGFEKSKLYDSEFSHFFRSRSEK